MSLNANHQILLGTGGGGTINSQEFKVGILGVISGSSLTKTGTGTLTLSNANTYTGGTTISAGTLLANNIGGSATGTGAVTVASAAALGGTGTVLGNVINNGTVSPGGVSGGAATLNVGGTYSQSANAALAMQIDFGARARP